MFYEKELAWWLLPTVSDFAHLHSFWVSYYSTTVQLTILFYNQALKEIGRLHITRMFQRRCHRHPWFNGRIAGSKCLSRPLRCGRFITSHESGQELLFRLNNRLLTGGFLSVSQRRFALPWSSGWVVRWPHWSPWSYWVPTSYLLESPTESPRISWMA